MQVLITREQIEAISVLFPEYHADAALVTSGGGRSDIFVALVDDDGTNLGSVTIDSLGLVDQEV
jgi:hypothetical protein